MARSTHTASGRPRVSRNIELLLAEDVESLGKRGEIVRVKPGFARNYLLPNGFATMATEANKRAVVRHTDKLAKLFEQKMKDMQSRADAIGKYSVTLEANANEEGHLYGSIMGPDISKALKAAGYAVEPDHVRLDGPLKELGMYTVKIQLHPEVKTEVKVWVVPAAKK
ncbi:MAG: ribosomal protein [Schlesneria sp.]|jgi:large subunit ribosomal protein L9|nr:ribosomal protein [Schlesneria sp.]